MDEVMKLILLSGKRVNLEHIVSVDLDHTFSGNLQHTLRLICNTSLSRSLSQSVALKSFLFDTPEPQPIGNTLCFATVLPFAHLHLLSSDFLHLISSPFGLPPRPSFFLANNDVKSYCFRLSSFQSHNCNANQRHPREPRKPTDQRNLRKP